MTDAPGTDRGLDDETRRLVSDLHAHLAATAELPVDPRASTWLGEAAAVAADAERLAFRARTRSARADATGEDVPRAVVEKRVEQVRALLSNVDATGNEAADERVAAARRLAAELADRTE